MAGSLLTNLTPYITLPVRYPYHPGGRGSPLTSPKRRIVP